jgi:hypothetical protein
MMTSLSDESQIGLPRSQIHVHRTKPPQQLLPLTQKRTLTMTWGLLTQTGTTATHRRSTRKYIAVLWKIKEKEIESERRKEKTWD